MATKTKKAGANSDIRLHDTRGGLKRLRAVLSKLSDHEGNISVKDDPDEVMAVRFALLDAARKEVTTLLKDAR